MVELVEPVVRYLQRFRHGGELARCDLQVAFRRHPDDSVALTPAGGTTVLRLPAGSLDSVEVRSRLTVAGTARAMTSTAAATSPAALRDDRAHRRAVSSTIPV